MRKTAEQRFWAKVDRRGEDECWEWTASTTKNGYGNFVVRKKMVYAHRFSYSLVVGPIQDGCVIRHSCDNKKCVNPKHLLPGTQQDNMDDKINRGRGRWIRGESHGNAKLTETDVLEIRAMYAKGGVTHKELSGKYGVCTATITQAIRRINWKHI